MNQTEILAKQIGVFPSVERVILFGSEARGTTSRLSDIDLAVECPNADDQEWLYIHSMDEPPYLFKKIDIVRYDTAPQELKDNIQRDGKVLFEKGKSYDG